MNELNKIETSLKLKDLTPAQQNELIQSIIANTPTLDNLTVEQFKQAVNKRTENKIVNDLDKLLNIKQIDYLKEKQIFLDSAKSKNTKDGYFYALKDLEEYCNLQQIENPLFLDPATADNWIYFETKEKLNKNGDHLSNATIRRNIAGVSSFFTFMSRRHEQIKNPFIGTKARPEKKNKSIAVYPTEKEFNLIINEITNDGYKDLRELSQLRKELSVIVYFMAFRGLRCGAFQDLTIIKKETDNGEQFIFETTTKGKTQTGTIPEICINALHNAGIKTTAKQIQPFTTWTSDKVKNYFKYYTNKLYGKNNLIHVIDAPYSCHDLRHFYALNEYNKDKDIYRLKKLLNHSSIATTEIYLNKLGISI